MCTSREDGSDANISHGAEGGPEIEKKLKLQKRAGTTQCVQLVKCALTGRLKRIFSRIVIPHCEENALKECICSDQQKVIYF